MYNYLNAGLDEAKGIFPQRNVLQIHLTLEIQEDILYNEVMTHFIKGVILWSGLRLLGYNKRYRREV